MDLISCSRMQQASRRGTLRAAMLFCAIGLAAVPALAQNPAPASQTPSATPQPLSSDERAEMLKLIRELQERVAKLEAAQSGTAPQTPAPSPSPAAAAAAKYDPSTSDDRHVWMEQVQKA